MWRFLTYLHIYIYVYISSYVYICIMYMNLLKVWRYSTHLYHWDTLTKNQTAVLKQCWAALHGGGHRHLFFLVETYQCGALLLFSLLLAVVD